MGLADFSWPQQQERDCSAVGLLKPIHDKEKEERKGGRKEGRGGKGGREGGIIDTACLDNPHLIETFPGSRKTLGTQRDGIEWEANCVCH